MSIDPVWQPLADELERWRSAGRKPRFWLRDDDAVAPTDALDRLLALGQRHAVPVALAVIPAHTGEALADRLDGEPLATVLVHGWSHDNHAPRGEKKQELGLHRPAEEICAELAAGLALLTRLHGPHVAPVLVPPWNRIARELVPHLPALGFAGLSVFGKSFAAPLAIVNSTVDIIDWHGTRGCRDYGQLVAEIASQLREDFDSQARHVGVLTHHLVHDAAAWAFLDRLFGITKSAGASWLSVAELLEQHRLKIAGA